MRIVAGDQKGYAIDARRLGHYLSKHKRRIVGGRQFVQDTQASGSKVATWRVVEVE
jgi:hypothetical protein